MELDPEILQAYHIARSADGLYQLDIKSFIYFFAQIFDIYVDDIALKLSVLPEENGICLTDDVEIGREYCYDRISGIDIKSLKHIEEERIKPATALGKDEIAVCPYGGIGYMGIEIDFEVS